MSDSQKPLSDTTAQLVVAIDVPSVSDALKLVARLDGVVSFFKVGPALYSQSGSEKFIDCLIREGLRVFLDAKLHDIPETVRLATKAAAERGVSIITAHAADGVLEAAVSGAEGSSLHVFAITSLTSREARRDEIVGLTTKAYQAGCDGIVCSALDLPSPMVAATPGIRMPGGSADDHKRSATPRQAVEAGSNYLVVGRPITQAHDPHEAAMKIIRDMEMAQ